MRPEGLVELPALLRIMGWRLTEEAIVCNIHFRCPFPISFLFVAGAFA